MPSSRYIDLTLGASGSSYTAPANGWFVFRKSSTSAGQSLYLGLGDVPSSGFEMWSSSANQTLGALLPVKKGKEAYIIYSTGGATQSFKFIYAEGRPTIIKY